MGAGNKMLGDNLHWTSRSHPGGVVILLVDFMLQKLGSTGSVGQFAWVALPTYTVQCTS